MGEVLGADWSFAHIDPHALIAAGYTHAFRYLATPPNGKIITPAEWSADRDAGLIVHLNFEDGAQDILDGPWWGWQKAVIAQSIVNMLPGCDPHCPIIWSADFDDRNVWNWADRIDAALGVIERVRGVAGEGIYGSIRVIEEMKRRNPARETWQTQAWSGDIVSPMADFYQRAGHTHFVPGINNTAYDEDVIIHVPNGGHQVAQELNPAPVIVSLTEFEHHSLGHCAAAVTANGAVYCDPANAYLGGGNHGASQGVSFDDTGRKAAVIRRPTPEEVAQGYTDGYVIVDTAGETYHFV